MSQSKDTLLMNYNFYREKLPQLYNSAVYFFITNVFSLVLYLVTSDGYTDTQTIVGCKWEDDVYVITDQSHKDIAVCTVENQTNETVESVHGNILLPPLSTVMDWRRPFDPKTLVKPVYDDSDANEVELDHTDHTLCL